MPYDQSSLPSDTPLTNLSINQTYCPVDFPVKCAIDFPVKNYFFHINGNSSMRYAKFNFLFPAFLWYY